MKKWLIFPLLAAAIVYSGCHNQRPSFEEIIIDDHGPMWCWTKTTGDLNGDGLTDLIAGGYKDGGIVWYEAPGWEKHTITAMKGASTDGETRDMDGDGDPDLVNIFDNALIWFENPGWNIHPVDSVELHDIEVDDFDGDGLFDIAGRNQGEFGSKGDTLFLFKQVSPDNWKKIKINIIDGEGLCASDLDGDGDVDIIINGYWLENSGDISNWKQHRFTSSWTWKNAFIDVGDLNLDGRKDIVMSPSELSGTFYRLSWFTAPASGDEWKENVIADSVETVIHSVRTADFDGDGLIDIVTAEMKQGMDPDEVAVYYNEKKGSSWEKNVISTGGSHSMRTGDFDNDGDPDIYGANWQEDTIKIWINRRK